MRVPSLVAVTVSLASLVMGCTKDWPDRDLAVVPLDLSDVGTFGISLPTGMKRSSEPGPLAIFEGEGSGAPYVLVEGSSFASRETADDYITGSTDGSGFEKVDVAGGYGIAFESNGPHVHVVKKVGAKFLTCDASMPGGTKDRPKRAAMIFRICSSMK